MSDPTKTSDIQNGSFVKIQVENNADEFEEGKVAEILTDGSFHHFGVKVKLESGIVGRVKIIYGFDVDEKIIQDLIIDTKKHTNDDEGQHLERKSSFMFNYDAYAKTGQKYPGMEKNILKAVQALANSEGGTLYIGIDDKKNILGLENDYNLLGENCGADEFEQKLIDKLVSSFTRNSKIFEYVFIKIIPYENKDICVVKVKPSPVAFIWIGSGQYQFYVRHGTTSRPYLANDFLDYWSQRVRQSEL